MPSDPRNKKIPVREGGVPITPEYNPSVAKKDPTMKGIQNKAYLGHYAKDEYLCKGHNTDASYDMEQDKKKRDAQQMPDASASPNPFAAAVSNAFNTSNGRDKNVKTYRKGRE